MRESDEGEMVAVMRTVRIAKEELLTILGDSEAHLTAYEGHCLELAVAELDGALTSLDSIPTQQ